MAFHKLTIKASFLTVLLLICCTESHGQVLQNIFNGYLITQQNDTLRGEIDVVSPSQAQSPSSVGFRKKTDYTFKRYYLASELKTVVLYSVTTKDTLIFYAKKISINFSERLAKQFNPNLPNVRQDTALFLRALTLGKANLYYFEDDALRPYFFIEKQGQPIAVLIDETKKITDDTHTSSLDFRNQLFQTLKDNRSFNKNIFNQLSLSANELVYQNLSLSLL